MWCSTVGCMVALTLGLLTLPFVTTAQPRGHIPRVAVLEPTSQARPAPCLFAFQQGLRVCFRLARVNLDFPWPTVILIQSRRGTR
jgi:hypothetical protein